MAEQNNHRRRNLLRILVVALCLAVAAGFGAYAHIVRHTDVIYAHFAYIPIVLSSMWWGRKGLVVALAFAAAILLLHFCARESGDLSGDVMRLAMLVLVAFVVATLKEQVTAGEDALRLSEAKYRLLTEKSLAGILVHRDARVLFANTRVGEVLGCAPDALVGRSLWDLGDEECRKHVEELLARSAQGGGTDLRYEWRVKRADGRMVWVDVASSVSDFEGQPAVLMHLYDITDRKEAEAKHQELAELASRQEEQLAHSTRLAEMGEMAAAVAHELNQPLTGIKNFATNASFMLTENAGTPEEVRENLRLIAEQVDRAARIINQMRELTRRSDREMAPVDINSAVRENVEFLMPQFRLSGIEVGLELQENLPPVVGDKVRLEQVFLNLLTNARQAMEASQERRLRVRTHLADGSDCPVVVEIEDTGVGFDPADVEKLFRPFYSTKTPGHGTGLGLSISLSIVRDHRGRIEATGTPGKGAKFTVRLPALAAGHDDHER